MICEKPGHKHGETSYCYKQCDCRCDDCTTTMRDYARRRDQLKREGRWEPLVDATPARDRITTLRGYGMSLADIARTCGVSQTTIAQIADGRRERTRPNALDAIISCPALPLRERGKVPTIHAARRIQALVAVGWPLEWIARGIGRDRWGLTVILSGRWPTVDGWMFREIDDFYRAHAMRPPAPRERYERTVVTLARNTARRRGWVPAVAWNDIDDPNEQPQGVAA